MVRVLVLLLLLIAFTLAILSDTRARTWYVTEDSTGDAPSIPAAMDSAAWGDTVLVGPGVYKVSVNMADGVVLKSESGPEETILGNLWTVVYFGKGVSGTLEGFHLTGVPYGGVWERGVVHCEDAFNMRILDNVVTNSGLHGIYCCFTLGGEVSGNTIADRIGDGPFIGIFADWAYQLDIHNNICAGHMIGIGVRDSYVTLECNDSWDNQLDFWSEGSGLPDWPWGTNLSEDPRFCDRPHRDYRLSDCSPCIPDQHPGGADCGRIGALEVGCYEPSTVESSSWGGVKAIFR